MGNEQEVEFIPDFTALVPADTDSTRKESLMFQHFEKYGLPDNSEYSLQMWARYEKWKEITEIRRTTPPIIIPEDYNPGLVDP